jgi:hypothetical protein
MLSGGVQVVAQLPATQAWPVVQTLVQVPQFAGSATGSTHAPEH